MLHNLEQLDEGSDDAIRLLRKAVDSQDWALCQDLLRFLRSIDTSGDALKHALSRVELFSSSLMSLPNGKQSVDSE